MTGSTLLRPDDGPARRTEKLRRIAAALIRRAEGGGAAAEGTATDALSGPALFLMAAAKETAAGAPGRPAARRAEAAPGDPASETQAVLDALPLGVCVFDGARRLSAWNRRAEDAVAGAGVRLTRGTALEALAGDLARRRWQDRDAPRRLAGWAAGDAPRPPLTVELRDVRGGTLDVRAQAMPAGGALLTFEDVGAEREALRRLHEVNETLETRVLERTEALIAARDAAETANREKTRFLAAAGHDLLQPLNAARLFLAALRETELDPGQARIAERLGGAFGSVDALLGALLDISRLEAGAARPEVRSFPLSRLFDPLRDEFGALAEQKGLRFRIAPSAAEVRSDPGLLRRALQNLAANAVRYTRTGTVLIGARRRGSDVAIEIRDTGPGIPRELQRAVFEAFRRLHPEDPDPQARPDGDVPGMGLGLAIVERACGLLGHPLEVESAPGRGSCFRVLVPRATPGVAGEVGPPSAIDFDLGEMIVLLAMPEGGARTALLRRLEAWGACPVAAADLAGAVEAVADLGAAPEMILAAPDLEDASGLETIRTLRGYFGRSAAALLATDPSSDPALGREAEAEDVELLPLGDDGGRLRAALAVARDF
ncbi:MAG: ATP-binding protein [Paracoccaceae bacterium]